MIDVVLADQKLDAEMLLLRDCPHRRLVGRARRYGGILMRMTIVSRCARIRSPPRPTARMRHSDL